MHWYYAEDTVQMGPVDDATLADLVRNGRIGRTTLVWNAAMTGWRPYGETAGGGEPGVELTEAKSAEATATANTAQCSQCWKMYPPEEMIRYDNAFVCAECKPAFFQKIREGVNLGKEMPYAGFWVRGIALFIDAFLLSLVIVPLTIKFAPNNNPPFLPFMTPFLFYVFFMGEGFAACLIGYGLTIAYRVLFHGRYGQTLGKMACGIRVVKPDGSGIGYLNACGRVFFSHIVILIPVMGWFFWLVDDLMVATNKEKCAMHDYLTGTRVIHM